jgi:hypothetical protein
MFWQCDIIDEHNVELTGHRKDCPKASDPKTFEKAA